MCSTLQGKRGGYTESTEKKALYCIQLFKSWCLVTCCKPQTNPQKSFGLCRTNWVKNRRQLHCLFELTPGVNFNFLLKGKHCRDLYPEDPITSTVSHKALKTQSKVLKQLRLESGKNRCKICNNFNPWPVTILLTWRKAAAPGGSNASCSQKKRWLTAILARAEMCF